MSGVEDPGGRRGRALGARPHGHRGQHGRQVGVKAAGRAEADARRKFRMQSALTGHDDGVAAEHPVGDAGLAQPQHRQQDLIQGAVGEGRTVGLRQGRAVGHLVTSAASLLGPNRPAASTSGTRTPARSAIRVR